MSLSWADYEKMCPWSQTGKRPPACSYKKKEQTKRQLFTRLSSCLFLILVIFLILWGLLCLFLFVMSIFVVLFFTCLWVHFVSIFVSIILIICLFLVISHLFVLIYVFFWSPSLFFGHFLILKKKLFVCFGSLYGQVSSLWDHSASPCGHFIYTNWALWLLAALSSFSLFPHWLLTSQGFACVQKSILDLY